MVDKDYHYWISASNHQNNNNNDELDGGHRKRDANRLMLQNNYQSDHKQTENIQSEVYRIVTGFLRRNLVNNESRLLKKSYYIHELAAQLGTRFRTIPIELTF